MDTSLMELSMHSAHPSSGLKEPVAKRALVTQHPVDFSQPWENGDAVFLVDDLRLYGNKVTLTMWSPVFKTMLSEQKDDETIPLADKTVEEILELFKVLHPPCSEIYGKAFCIAFLLMFLCYSNSNLSVFTHS